MSTPDRTLPHDATPSADDGVDRERRALVLAGIGSLPVVGAGCGGGSGDEPVRERTSSLGESGVSAVVPGFPVLRKPTVAQLGSPPLATPALRDAPATSAFWIVVDAGSDARAVAVMAGAGSIAPRLELPVNLQVGTSLRLDTDRAIRSVHVARAGQSGYAVTNGAQLVGAAVARWDFDSNDNIQRLEVIAHPPVVNTAGIELECWGSAP